MVVDLRFVNEHFESKPLKYETLAVIKYAPLEAAYGMSIDISDAYHHLHLSPLLVSTSNSLLMMNVFNVWVYPLAGVSDLGFSPSL